MPTITYNIPADKQDEIIAALQFQFTMPGATAQDLNNRLTAHVKEFIKSSVASHKRFLASQNVADINLD
jgi:hypothetical protein